MIRVLSFLLMIGGLSACAGTAKKSTAEFRDQAPKAKVVEKAKPKPRLSNEIEFDRHSAALQSDDKLKLDRLIDTVSRNDTIEDVKIVAWADGGYPEKDIRKLAKNEIHLADARARSVEIYLKSKHHALHTEQFNMAKRPSILQELLATRDARVKESLTSAGLTKTNPDLHSSENASKVLVLLVVKAK